VKVSQGEPRTRSSSGLDLEREQQRKENEGSLREFGVVAGTEKRGKNRDKTVKVWWRKHTKIGEISGRVEKAQGRGDEKIGECSKARVRGS